MLLSLPSCVETCFALALFPHWVENLLRFPPPAPGLVREPDRLLLWISHAAGFAQTRPEAEKVTARHTPSIATEDGTL